MLIIGLMLVTIICLSFRNAGLLPRLFWDEWRYSMSSRHLDFSVVDVPNYLYYLTYRLTNTCGEGFLACTKLLNAMFFAGCLPFVYTVSRMIVTRPVALWISLLTACSPLNSYTTYFMPESMYFFGFWVLTWLLLAANPSHPFRYGVCAGVALGFTILIKFHGLFLVPPCLLLLIWRVAGASNRNGARSIVLAVSSFALATIVVRFGFGHAIAGTSGSNLTGSMYGEHASEALSQLESDPLLQTSLFNLRLHLALLAILIPVPLLVAMRSPGEARPDEAGPSHLSAMRIYCLGLAITLLAVTSVFSVSIAARFINEFVGSIQTRFYDFTLPLFFALGCSAVGARRDEGKSWADWPSCLVVLILLYVAWVHLRAEASAPPFLAPEAFALISNDRGFVISAATSAIAVVAWLVSPRLAGAMFAFVVLPLNTLAGSYLVTSEARRWIEPNVFDRAGEFVRQNLNRFERGRVFVITPPSDVLGFRGARTLFHIDHPEARHSRQWHGPGDYPDGTEWILQFEGAPRRFPGPVMDLGDFFLIKVPGNTTIDLSRTPSPVVARSLSGFGPAGPRGRQLGKEGASIRFSEPLPSKFELILTTDENPFELKRVVAEIGGRVKEFELDAAGRSARLTTSSTDGVDTIKLIERPPLESAGPHAQSRNTGANTIQPLRLRSVRVITLQ